MARHCTPAHPTRLPPGRGLRGHVVGDAMKGAAVYLWHCNRDGAYSL
ncbi:hypothetical protein BH10ACT10_BH10ACT10_22960 [soil metagenome]